MGSSEAEKDDTEEADKDRLFFVRKHGIPIPIFREFLRVFAERYRGKFRKDRERVEKYRKSVASDPDDVT